MAAAEARLDLVIAGFRRAITQARALMIGFGQGAGRIGLGLGKALFGGVIGSALMFGRIVKQVLTSVAVLGAAVGGAMAVGLKKAFDVGGRMSDIAAQTGVAAGNVLLLEEAFRQAGVSSDKVPLAVGRLQRAIVEATEGVATYKRAFSAIGLDANDLLGKDPGAVFAEVSRAISELDDPTERAARAMQILGRSGGELLALFNDGDGMAKAAATLGRQAEVMNEVAGDFDRASDILNSVFVKLRGFFVGFGASIVEQILPVLEAFDKIDLTGIGERLGASISDAVDYAAALFETLTLEEMMKLAGLALKLGFQEAVNYLVRALGATISLLAGEQAWVGIEDALRRAAKVFKDEILGVLNLLSDADPEVTNTQMLEARRRAVEAAGQKFDRGRDFGEGRGSIRELLNGDFEARFGAAFEKVDGLFDTTDLQAEIKKLTAAAEFVAANNRDIRAAETAERRSGQGGNNPPSIASDAAAGSKAALAGAFSGAVNLLLGKSVNEFIADEARKTNKLLGDIKGTMDQVERNTQPKTTKPPEVKVNLVPTFAEG